MIFGIKVQLIAKPVNILFELMTSENGRVAILRWLSAMIKILISFTKFVILTTKVMFLFILKDKIWETETMIGRILIQKEGL